MSLGVSKERITIRLSPEVVQAFRASEAGWQTLELDVFIDVVSVLRRLRRPE